MAPEAGDYFSFYLSICFYYLSFSSRRQKNMNGADDSHSWKILKSNQTVIKNNYSYFPAYDPGLIIILTGIFPRP